MPQATVARAPSPGPEKSLRRGTGLLRKDLLSVTSPRDMCPAQAEATHRQRGAAQEPSHAVTWS